MTSRGDEAVEILYVSSVASPAEFERMKSMRRAGVQEVTYGMSEAGFKFHTLVMRGLLDSGCRVRSVVGRHASRRFYRGRLWRRRVEEPAPGLVVDHLAFPNVPVAKQLWLAAATTVAAWRWRRRTRHARRRVVVVDCAYVSVLPGVLRALKGSGVPTIGVVCDLYSYMADVSDASDRRTTPVHAAARRSARDSLRRLGGFVVLTEAMADVVEVGDRPYLVMEGLADSGMRTTPPRRRSEHPTVLYAGALRKEYGLEDLVRGFQRWDRPDAELVVYGQGEYAAELAALAAQDPRLTYRGAVPLAEVVAAEQEAWLLVNPRPADQEFTRFSFPSKNMEYLASGTAVLTTRLPGMPEEYYEHVLTIDGPGPDAVAEALERALRLGREGLDARGRRGRDFVLEEKNNVVQAARLLELADRVAR